VHPEDINRRASLKQLITDKKDLSRLGKPIFLFRSKIFQEMLITRWFPSSAANRFSGRASASLSTTFHPEAPFGLARLAGKGALLNPV
jgi:hypothetical protein